MNQRDRDAEGGNADGGVVFEKARFGAQLDIASRSSTAHAAA